MKYFLVAGEASGDLHGANLMKAIKNADPEAQFAFWGGDRMALVSNGLLKHYQEITLMGFVEVLMNIRSVFSNLRLCKAQILAYQPDVVVLIDYPGFNLRIAEFCKSNGIRTAYYIAPKVWAWKENRAKKLEQFVDDLLLIFPFEVSYFKKWRVRAHYVGNPLLDEIHAFTPDPDFRKKLGIEKPVITLMPGSRKQEINRMLPMMLQAVSEYPGHAFVIAGAPGINPDFYTPFLNEQVKIVFGSTYDLLHISESAIVCSGTATLETALFKVPQVCAYAANPLSYFIARMLVKVKYISLVNLCMERACITELIQGELHVARLKDELQKLQPGRTEREALLKSYDELARLLGGKGASEKAARIIVEHQS